MRTIFGLMTGAILISGTVAAAPKTTPASGFKQKKTANKIETINDASYDTFILGNFVVLEFFSDHCGHCRQFGPVYEEVAYQWREGLTFGKIKVNEEPHATKTAGVRSIPTVIIYKNGTEIARNEGASSAEELKSFIESANK